MRCSQLHDRILLAISSVNLPARPCDGQPEVMSSKAERPLVVTGDKGNLDRLSFDGNRGRLRKHNQGHSRLLSSEQARMIHVNPKSSGKTWAHCSIVSAVLAA